MILKDIPKASALAHPIGSINSETEGVKESEIMPTMNAPRPNALASEKIIEVAVARNLVGKVSLDQIPKTPCTPKDEVRINTAGIIIIRSKVTKFPIIKIEIPIIPIKEHPINAF